LSDLIFGLALSIGAITLVGNVSSLTFGQLTNDITIFGFSFLILISVWLRYTRIMSVLPLETRWAVTLNMALLFTVSIEPFLFNVLQLDTILNKSISSQFYAADLGVMMLILGGFTSLVSFGEKKLIPKDTVREFKVESITIFVAGALFLISIAPNFWAAGPRGLYWRYYLWIVPFALSSVRRRTMDIIGMVKKSSVGRK
jgi:uncharacterized membrane protein